MQEVYETPTMDILRFDAEDIITTSTGLSDDKDKSQLEWDTDINP